ncbi:MAG: hypothetical protein ABSF29_14825 [Tepidisphaeraceae bacterium]|jgi:hypothetical protein
MPIKIPPRAKCVHVESLSIIRAITDLAETRRKELVTAVKAILQAKKAKWAQNENCIGRIKGGEPTTFVDPVKLFRLVKNGKISLADFLGCVEVRKDNLKKKLADPEIKRLLKRDGKTSKSLQTEWKPGYSVDLDALQDALIGILRTKATVGALPRKAA